MLFTPSSPLFLLSNQLKIWLFSKNLLFDWHTLSCIPLAFVPSVSVNRIWICNISFMSGSNRCDFRRTKKSYKFFQMVQLSFRDLHGCYTSVWMKHRKSGVRWTEGSRMVKLNTPVSPPHLVSRSRVSGTRQEVKDAVPANSERVPCEVDRCTISVPPSQGCWEDRMNWCMQSA